MGFAGASLTCKQANGYAIHDACHTLASDDVVHLSLRSLRAKAVIKRELKITQEYLGWAALYVDALNGLGEAVRGSSSGRTRAYTPIDDSETMDGWAAAPAMCVHTESREDGRGISAVLQLCVCELSKFIKDIHRVASKVHTHIVTPVVWDRKYRSRLYAHTCKQHHETIPSSTYYVRAVLS